MLARVRNWEPCVPFPPFPSSSGKDLLPAADTLLENTAGISAVMWGQVNFAVPQSRQEKEVNLFPCWVSNKGGERLPSTRNSDVGVPSILFSEGSRPPHSLSAGKGEDCILLTQGLIPRPPAAPCVQLRALRHPRGPQTNIYEVVGLFNVKITCCSYVE